MQLTNQTLKLIPILTIILLFNRRSVVSIRLIIATSHTHPEKFIRDNVVAPCFIAPVVTAAEVNVQLLHCPVFTKFKNVRDGPIIIGLCHYQI